MSYLDFIFSGIVLILSSAYPTQLSETLHLATLRAYLTISAIHYTSPQECYNPTPPSKTRSLLSLPAPSTLLLQSHPIHMEKSKLEIPLLMTHSFLGSTTSNEQDQPGMVLCQVLLKIVVHSQMVSE